MLQPILLAGLFTASCGLLNKECDYLKVAINRVPVTLIQDELLEDLDPEWQQNIHSTKVEPDLSVDVDKDAVKALLKENKRYLHKFREYAKTVVISFRIYGVAIGLGTAWKMVAVMMGSYFTLLRLKRWQLI